VSSELARISLVAAIFRPRDAGRVQIGIGDDAAVIAPGSRPLVWTIDAQVEGTHFRRDWLGWEDVGWRSFMAAASDLAAMGAAPVAALSALVLAPDVDDAALAAIATGQAAAASALGTTIAGGNLAHGAPTSITTTLLGEAVRPILRSGARPGDRVLLGGAIGLAAAGLAALETRACCRRMATSPRAHRPRGCDEHGGHGGGRRVRRAPPRCVPPRRSQRGCDRLR
jgi:thiamine-monophosphate kinase